jgi:hypothetical protein
VGERAFQMRRVTTGEVRASVLMMEGHLEEGRRVSRFVRTRSRLGCVGRLIVMLASGLSFLCVQAAPVGVLLHSLNQ